MRASVNLSVVLSQIRSLGFQVRINHYRLCYVNGALDCVPNHEITGDMTVCNHGGFTRVELYRYGNLVFSGKHNFNNHPFCRKIGVRSALGKATGSLLTLA